MTRITCTSPDYRLSSLERADAAAPSIPLDLAVLEGSRGTFTCNLQPAPPDSASGRQRTAPARVLHVPSPVTRKGIFPVKVFSPLQK